MCTNMNVFFLYNCLLYAGGFPRAEESVKMASVGYSTTFLVLMLFLVWLLQHVVTRYILHGVILIQSHNTRM